MTEKTVIISKFDETLNVKSNVVFNIVVADGNDGLTEQEIIVEYDTLTAAEQLKIDEALTVLEAKIV